MYTTFAHMETQMARFSVEPAGKDYCILVATVNQDMCICIYVSPAQLTQLRDVLGVALGEADPHETCRGDCSCYERGMEDARQVAP